MSEKDLAYSIRSLIHSYDGRIVLDIRHLDIASGQICILTGPNGSGKTTLLSILALLLKPASGSVFLRGKEAVGSTDLHLRRQVTLVHQKPVLFSTTVRHNVEYGLRASGLEAQEIRSRTDRILEKTNLIRIAGRPARKLSGGEAQRVILARALVLETPAVLLDEPTNSLDDASRPLVYDLLREANERGTTIMIATHDHGMLEASNPRILKMDKGMLVSD
jgi:tungstate transport system ATP-binding protein